MRSFCVPENSENAGNFQKLKLGFLVKIIMESTLDEAYVHVRAHVTLYAYLNDDFHWRRSHSRSRNQKQISLFATFLSGTGGLPWNRHGSHIVLTLPIRLLGVDDPCVR